jgi:hypothetical protein
MINKRIHRLENTFGVDANQIIEQLGIDGVYMEYDKSNPKDKGNLVINEAFYSQELANRLTNAIPTIKSARTAAIKALKNSTYENKDFIGPMSNKITANQIAREVQAKYEINDAWSKIREKYYDVEDILEATGNQELIDKVGQFGSDFYHGRVSYSDLISFRDTIITELDKI